jgi:BirA family transcriptional regulator, biotin operon repressor / biotin---[acetyl-CoA-carboxylase] ligase
VTTADSLAPERVEPLLTGRFGRPYLYEETCASTQELVRDRPEEGAVALCEEQSAGRGRQGRPWVAPRGTAILCSVLLLPPENRAIPELSLVAGTSVAEALEGAIGLAVQVKWPNDVMLNRRKVAGVIAEAGDGKVVIGIGVNVTQERDQLPADARVAPASLYTSDGIKRERAPILASILQRLESNYDAWAERGLDGVYDSLGSRDFLRGRRVFLNGSSGVGVKIDRDGRFLVEVDGEVQALESGELLFER